MARPGAGSGLWLLSPNPGLVEDPFGLLLSPPQIRDFLRQLKGRVAREAIQRVHPGVPKGPRHQETQIPAPIEVRQGKAPQSQPVESGVVVGASA